MPDEVSTATDPAKAGEQQTPKNPEVIYDEEGRAVPVAEVFRMRKESTKTYEDAAVIRKQANEQLERANQVVNSLLAKANEPAKPAPAAPAAAVDLSDVQLLEEGAEGRLQDRVGGALKKTETDLRAEVKAAEDRVGQTVDIKLAEAEARRRAHDGNVGGLREFMKDQGIPAVMEKDLIAELAAQPKTDNRGTRDENGYWRLNETAYLGAWAARDPVAFRAAAEAAGVKKGAQQFMEAQGLMGMPPGGGGETDWRKLPFEDRVALMESLPQDQKEAIVESMTDEEVYALVREGAEGQIRAQNRGRPVQLKRG